MVGGVFGRFLMGVEGVFFSSFSGFFLGLFLGLGFRAFLVFFGFVGEGCRRGRRSLDLADS